jgi:DNA mismatch repair protein MutL
VLDVPPASVDVEALQPPAPVGEGLFEAAAPFDDASYGVHSARELESAEAPVVASVDEHPVPALMQLQRTYLVFEHDHGVVLIDQHSAHERVLYEQFMGVLESGAQPSQRLLFPMTLHLGPEEAEAFERNREIFERLGFEIEGFGGHTLLVRAVPMPHPRFDPERCLRETLASLTGDREVSTHARHERLAATVACKAAIKAGDALSPGEMRALYIALRDTTLPAHDVHGRATIVQLTWDEIERRFGRR